jgi:DNA polymerase IV
MEAVIRLLEEKTWSASRKESRIACTVVLKLKTNEFHILTRSPTPASPPSTCEELTNIALSRRERVNLAPRKPFRLVGGGLSNFREPQGKEDTPEQPASSLPESWLNPSTSSMKLIGTVACFVCYS